MELQIIELLQKIIKELYWVELKEIKLETPPKKELWDFAFGCFTLARDLKKAPPIIAWELAEVLNKDDLIEEASVAGPYLNLKISKSIFTNNFNEIYKNKEKFLKQNIWEGKTIVVDYIWANVWKVLHIGHMCTPNQWQVMINLYKKLWYNVISDSHIWDWGIIFGKLIAAYKLWWDETKLKEDAVEYLHELYIKITTESEKDENLEQVSRDEFKKLSEGDKESQELWKKMTKSSIEAMNVQLARLNIKPDYNIGESFYEWLWLAKMEDYPDLKWDMKSIVKELVEKGIATKNDDKSVWVKFDEDLKIPSCILQKRDWTHGYLASDLAAIKYRMDNWNPEKIVYFVDIRQQLHLRQAFEIAKKAWWLTSPQLSPQGEGVATTELFHAYNWFISLKDWAMSSRKWRIIKLDALLDEAEARAEKIILEKRDDITWEELKKLSKTIWIWAIKYWYLKKSRETDVIFDWDEFVSFEWNSGPYIQYAYVRARRILENWVNEYLFENPNDFLDRKDINIKEIFNNDDWSFENAEEINLLQILNTYSEVKLKTAETNSPHILAKFTYELTKAFNSLYNNVHILNEKDEGKKIIRLKLVDLFSIVLKDSFKILGIDMPEKM